MSIDLDFTGVPREERESRDDFEPVPDGWYEVRVERAEETTASTGSPGVKVALIIEGGDFDGRWIWDRIWFTPKSMAFSRDKLEAIGITIPDGKFRLNPSDLVGRRCAVRTKQEEYNGKLDAKVAAYDRRSGSFPGGDWRADMPEAPAAVGGGEQSDDIPFACSKV